MGGGQPGSGARAPEEEIRFAVVLNGGVSLAVWMGGAVLELDRLTRGLDGYAGLLDLLRSRARADVISGTSAGGINGAALALSQVNADADLGVLRDVWADQGRMESLLRQPFHGSPPSLLQGDEYFLPQLQAALGRLATPFRDRPDRPVDLTITTTLLRGAHTVTVDALGQRLAQRQHDGRFRFRRDPPEAPPQGEEPRDDFPAGDPAARAATVERLALAARCTASFPVAFEPSFVPVRAGGDGGPGGRDGSAGGFHRPDMGQVASWRTTGPTGERPEDRSRFAVDGGLLVNTPTRSAIEAVERMPAADPVRRVMLLVYPHAPSSAPERPDAPDGMPTVTTTARMVLGALSSQGSRTFVEEVERHNRAAAGRRGGRIDVLSSLEAAPGQLPAELHRLAAQVFPHYRSLRMRRVARDLAGRFPARATWSYERARAAAQHAQDAWRAARDGAGLPYVPDRLVPEDPGLPARGWPWGITAAEGVTAAALDLLKRLVWVLPPGDTEAVRALREQRSRLHEARARLRVLAEQADRPWREDPVLAGLDPDGTYWTLRLAVFDALYPGRPEALEALLSSQALREPVAAAVRALVPVDRVAGPGNDVRAVVEEVAATVAAVVPHLAVLDDTQLGLGGLSCWRDLLVPEPGEDEPTEARPAVLQRLLALEVATACLADEPDSGGEQAVDLVQVSLQTRNGFAVYSRDADDKVGGWALARFSGFLKQSWRINDWIWGRLDGATMLCRTLTDPERLRRLSVLEGWLAEGRTVERVAEEKVAALVQDLFGLDVDAVSATDVRLRRAAEQATEELAAAIDPATPPGDLPPTLEGLAALAAWALHVRIVRAELPALAGAIRADGAEGANPRSNGERFLAVHADLLQRLGAGDGATRDAAERLRLGLAALAAFDRAGIGRENLAEESASDQLIRTATTAAGVAVTVADGERSGLGLVKPVTGALRGLVLLPYWTITGLTRGGAIARFLALLALALGGTFVTLALFGALPVWATGPAAALGGGALLAAFAYSAMRTGTLLHGLVLLSPVVPLVTYAVTEVRGEDRAAATTAVSVVTVVALLVAGLVVLGSLPSPMRSPLAAVVDGLDRLGAALRVPGPPLAAARGGALAMARARAALVVALVLVAAAAGLAALGWATLVALPWGLTRLRAGATWLDRQPLWLVLAAAVVLVLASGWVAARGGRSFRTWQPGPSRPGGGRRPAQWREQRVEEPAVVAAGWGVVYGAVYLAVAVAAVLLLSDDVLDAWWARAAVATALLLATVLLLVTPWLLPLRRRVRIARSLLAAGLAASTAPPGTPAEARRCLLDVIERQHRTYRFLVHPGADRPEPAGESAAQPVETRPLELTLRGRRLAEHLHHVARQQRSAEPTPGGHPLAGRVTRRAGRQRVPAAREPGRAENPTR